MKKIAILILLLFASGCLEQIQLTPKIEQATEAEKALFLSKDELNDFGFNIKRDSAVFKTKNGKSTFLGTSYVGLSSEVEINLIEMESEQAAKDGVERAGRTMLLSSALGEVKRNLINPGSVTIIFTLQKSKTYISYYQIKNWIVLITTKKDTPFDEATYVSIVKLQLDKLKNTS